MVQRGEHLRFALESGQAIGIAREYLGQDLERDIAAEPRIARAPHFAHAARAEGGQHFIRAEAHTSG
jgi:hypothetical protein